MGLKCLVTLLNMPYWSILPQFQQLYHPKTISACAQNANMQYVKLVISSNKTNWRQRSPADISPDSPDSPMPPTSKTLMAWVGTGLCHIMPLSQLTYTIMKFPVPVLLICTFQNSYYFNTTIWQTVPFINNPITKCVLPNIQSAAFLIQFMSMSSTSNSTEYCK